MTRCIALLRVSTDDQHLGIEAQRAAVAQWAKANGATVVQWYEERVSGGADIDKRPVLLDAIAALRAEKASVLVVAKRDRIARSVLNAILIEKMVDDAGATIVAANGEGNGSTPEDALMRTILSAVSAWEKSRIALRTREALAAKKARGERVGKVPLGKRVADDGKTLEDDPAEAAARRVALRMRDEGVSLRQIGARLDALGHKTRSGAAWSPGHVQRLVARDH